VQLRNPDTAYIHEIAKLAEIPEKGKKFLIDYRNGCGLIQEQEEKRHVCDRSAEVTR
jgi:hypothetical protein